MKTWYSVWIELEDRPVLCTQILPVKGGALYSSPVEYVILPLIHREKERGVGYIYEKMVKKEKIELVDVVHWEEYPKQRETIADGEYLYSYYLEEQEEEIEKAGENQKQYRQGTHGAFPFPTGDG